MAKLIVFRIFFLSILVSTLADYSAEDCKELGYNKPNLLCSTCDKSLKYNLSLIHEKCKECCLKDDDDNALGLKRYPKAVLEVCTCKFGVYPQIQAFIKRKPEDKFKNLQTRYVRGLDPVIKLYGDDGKVEDVLAIHKWDTDSVEEFLATHLSMD